MSDRYQDLAHNPVGKFLVKNLGLPNPPYLDRYTGGALVTGSVLTGSATPGPVSKAVAAALKAYGIDSTGVRADGKKYKGLVFDATGIDSAAVRGWPAGRMLRSPEPLRGRQAGDQGRLRGSLGGLLRAEHHQGRRESRTGPGQRHGPRHGLGLPCEGPPA